MVRYWVHTPGTDNASLGPTPSPANYWFFTIFSTNQKKMDLQILYDCFV